MSMRKHSLPLGAAALLLVLVLGTLGFGYAYWTKVLTVAGTVQTGELDAAWTFLSCAEFHTWPDPPTHFPDDFGEAEGKDVGSTTAYVDPVDPRIIHFTIDNGYPSYAVDCQVHFANAGTIPWIIRGTTIEAISGNLDNCTLSGNKTKTLSCDELTVIYADGIGMQVDPEDGGASSLTVHVEQPAEPNSTYDFEVRVCVSQWNEPMTAAECFGANP